MEIKSTEFEDLFEIVPNIFSDNRGYFLETFRKSKLEEAGLKADFVQDNQSFSTKGVVRGLHLQMAPHEQIKLVRAVTGKVLDVVVDVRKGSKTFGETFMCILDSRLGNMLYIPGGFAHGFRALEDTVFAYKCSAYYDKKSEDGIRFDDPDLNIKWDIKSPLVSEKDMQLVTFKAFANKYGLV